MIDYDGKRPIMADLSRSVPSRFRYRARLHPEAIAVTCGTERLTCEQLDTLSDRIAHGLWGIRPEAVVAVYLERSTTLPVALMGILKAGAAYLPLDPALPAGRIRFMLEDAGVELVLTQQSLMNSLPAAGCAVATVEDLLSRKVPPAEKQLLSEPAPLDGLAYVIFTSGSTGSPKGIEILHGGLANFLEAMQSEIGFCPGDRMLAHSSLSFDISVFELFLPLVAGGEVVLVPRSVAMQGDALRRVIETSGIRVMLATPASWQLLVRSGWQGDPNLTAISGGEILHPSLGKYLSARTRALWNHYGPSETTIAATTYRVRGDEERYPIGRVLPGLQAFVLSEDLSRTVPGSAGELCIGGVGLARGYRNRPSLTAERFVKIAPDGGALSQRVYRTGDLVRDLGDGNLEFIGRIDNQVKIRGFRIELEEIETVLGQHEGVRDCAVLAVERTPDAKTLVAFYSPSGARQPASAELRSFLRERLPYYMLPSSFFGLEELPITTHGKADRDALRAIALRTIESPLPESALESQSIEAALTGLWRRTLGHPEIAPTDSFFDLGGTSLMAATLVAGIERKFRIRLPLSVFFEAPTVARMVELIGNSGWLPSWSPLVPIQPAGTRPPVFCVHPIGGNVLSFQALAAHLGPDQPVYGLQARGLNGRDLPHRSIEAMAADYLSFIRQAAPDGPCVLVGYSAGGVVGFEMARQLTLAGQPPMLLALVDSYIEPGEKQSARNNRKADNTFASMPILVARLRKFWNMERGERIASIGRNTRYTRVILMMEMRIRIWVLLRKLRIPVRPLRSVDDAFALAVRAYRPEPVGCDVVLFRAQQGDGDHVDDPTMGWGPLIKGRLVIRRVGGTHFTMLYEPFVSEVASALTGLIDGALAQDAV